jgi:proteasome accessory factor C
MVRRLRRILALLPYAMKHPGVTVGELARKFDVSRNEIVADLDLVFLCGLPGYGPGDLIDVSIEDDRVHVRMADYFSAPLRLAPAEALALYAGGQALIAMPDMQQADALRRALAKLGRALGMPGGSDASELHLSLQPGPAQHLATLGRALRESRRVRLEYLSASRGELSERVVDPWGLIVAWGRSYLVGWDHLSEDERMFRTDRIKMAELTDESSNPPSDFDPGRYGRAFVARGGERTISLEVSPAVARWFGDYYPVTAVRKLDDSWQRVELAADSDHWAAIVVLRLGKEVRAVQPESVAASARELARAIADAHRLSA